MKDFLRHVNIYTGACVHVSVSLSLSLTIKPIILKKKKFLLCQNMQYKGPPFFLSHKISRTTKDP